MLVSFGVKNFYSFRDETLISFEVPQSFATNSELYFTENGQTLSKALIVLGANASGKTNLLKALVFLIDFAANSFSKIKPDGGTLIQRFLLSDNSLSDMINNFHAPTEFELMFNLNDKLYRYELHLTNTTVLYEGLFVKTSKKFSYLFERRWDEKSKKFQGATKNFGYSTSKAMKVRRNISLLSYANQDDVNLAREIIGFFEKMKTNIHPAIGHFSHDYFEAAEIFYKNPDLKELLNQIIPLLDLGLESIDIEIDEQASDSRFKYVPYGVHKQDLFSQDSPKWPKYRPIIFSNESNGTRSLFCLLSILLQVLSKGGTAIIDEFNSGLHPDMLSHIVELFFNRYSNPHNAQLIFTSHNLEPMMLLDKEQIILVEKDNEQVSHAWHLSDMQGVRPLENFLGRYKAGAYGATPNFG